MSDASQARSVERLDAVIVGAGICGMYQLLRWREIGLPPRDQSEEVVAHTLFLKTDSWFMGANIPGKKRMFLGYGGGLPRYREKCAEVAARGYEGFNLE